MAQTLWRETKTRKHRRRRSRELEPAAPYSITEGDDCEILGHALNHFDLAGCTTCIACHVKIFCPQCIPQHPTDPQAVPELCPQHEESQVSA